MEVDCMPTRHRSAWRRRQQGSRVARIAVPIAIPVALAVVIGAAVALTDGFDTHVDSAALANCASPGVAASAAVGSSAAPSPAPCPSGGSATASAASPAATAAAAPAVNPEAGRPDLALTNPMDPTGAAISLTQDAAAAANSLNCSLTVPANPLSAKGLATAWQLGDGCDMANPSEAAFVEATILAPNGKLSIYDPLVVTQGTTPAAAPAAPTIARGSQVVIDVGFNGNNLVLQGAGATQGRCVDAFGNSIMSQTSACNAPAFFAAANAQIARGTLKVPALGTGSDGKACETTESFSLIDQDQSDNVISEYLLTGNGQTAQNSAANKNALGGATMIGNGSDNALLGHFVDAALGCPPFTVPDSTSPNGTDSSQAVQSLSARQFQKATPALLPVNDPQLMVAGQFSIGKTNAFRMMNDQPLLGANTNKDQNAATYCQNMINLQPAKLQLDSAKEVGFASPVPATGNNLATFLGARLSGSFDNLNCGNFGLKNPVTVTADGNGVATAVTYNVAQQKATVPAGTPANGTGAGKGGGSNKKVPVGRRGHHQNGAGM
jgi:hypothetical protein